MLPASSGPGVPGAVTPLQFVVQYWDFLWFASSCISTGLFDFQIDLTQCGDRQITSDYVRSTLFFGSGAVPMLHPSKLLPMSGTVKIFMRDLSGSPNTVQPTFYGRRCSPGDMKARNHFGQGQGLFLLTTPSAGVPILNALGTQTASIVLDPSSHMRCSIINAEARLAATPTVVNQGWSGKMNLRDPRFNAAYDWSPAFVPAPAWTGNALAPFIPPCAPVFGKGGPINLNYVDTTGSPNNSLWQLFVCESLTPDNPAAWD